MANGSNQKKKKSGGWWWLIFVAAALIAQAGENDNLRLWWLRLTRGSSSQLGRIFDFKRLLRPLRIALLRRGITVDPALLLLGAAVLLVVIIVLVSSAAKRRARAAERSSTVRSTAARSSTAGRTSAAVQRRDPRTKSFTQPDAYCVVCDHSGEDHFQHDREQRIKQLDEWLKNGLIDRSEYKVMLSRYERDL